jgi:hypothetical protein
LFILSSANQHIRLINISSFVTLALSVLGFSPSIITAIKERVFWSVSHDLPHTDNDFLLPHSIFVGVWLLCLLANFSSGPALPSPSLLPSHRFVGYVGVVCVVLGMLFALLNEYTYASPASLIGNFYTTVLALGASLNAVQGVRAAAGGGGGGYQQRFPGAFKHRSLLAHKDHMLMSLC